uniref:Haem-binding uptake Tiki superfamily ChaN domain-containing protein n=1 Tax=Haptolina brevifila TaxID=156173 RepID=A0A7S2DUA0_9EUKA
MASAGTPPMSPTRLRRSYEAMTLWDEYMAASIAGHMGPRPMPLVGTAAPPATAPVTAPVTLPPAGSVAAAVLKANEWEAEAVREGAPSKRMVVLVGAGHVQGRVGIPDRVTRRTGLSTFSVVPLSVPWAASGLPAIERPLDPSEAEWVLYTQREIRGEPMTGKRSSAAGMSQMRTVALPSTPQISRSALRSMVLSKGMVLEI